MSLEWHGLLLINKPAGITSHDVVDRVRKILKIKEVGHCGTLDPMATGLLVLAVGEGTKLVSVLTEGDKGYQGAVQFGIDTDTLDITGQVLRSTDLPTDLNLVERQALALQGSLELKVPRFSAIKVDGQKLYEKARREQEFEPPTRTMSIFNLQVAEIQATGFKFSFQCSKGTYVRSWVQSLGEQLGVGATLSQLHRTLSLPYRIDDAIELGDLSPTALPTAFIPLAYALPEWPLLRVFQFDQHLLRNGQISKGLKAQLIRLFQPEHPFKGVRVFAGAENRLLALIGLESDRGFFIKRVFKG